MNDGWLSCLNWIAAWELVEGATRQADVLGRRDNGVKVTFGCSSCILISFAVCRCHAKASIGSESNFLNRIASSVCNVASLHSLLQDSWLPSIELYMYWSVTVTSMPGLQGTYKIHMERESRSITISQDPGWIVRVIIVLGNAIELADVEIKFNKDLRETLDIERSWASCQAVLISWEGHMGLRILHVKIVTVPAGGKSH